MWSHRYFGRGQTDKEGSFLRRMPYCLEVHNPLYGIKQKNNKLSFLYPLSICWKDQHWVDIGSSLLSLDRWGKATLCQGKCHPGQELRDDFFLLRVGLNGRKKSCLSPLSPGTQGVFLHSQTLSALFLTEAYGECLERHGKNKGSGKHMSKTPPRRQPINPKPMWACGVPPFPMTDLAGETEAANACAGTCDKGLASGEDVCTGMWRNSSMWATVHPPSRVGCGSAQLEGWVGKYAHERVGLAQGHLLPLPPQPLWHMSLLAVLTALILLPTPFPTLSQGGQEWLLYLSFWDSIENP